LFAAVPAFAGRPGAVAASPASLAISVNPVSMSNAVTIMAYPGSYLGQKMFIKYQCYQNNEMRAFSGSFDLQAAVSQGLAGYNWAGDHYNWNFVPSKELNFTLLPGAANCSMQLFYQNRKLQVFQIATGSFDAIY
jgi:hypothetical protein